MRVMKTEQDHANSQNVTMCSKNASHAYLVHVYRASACMHILQINYLVHANHCVGTHFCGFRAHRGL